MTIEQAQIRPPVVLLDYDGVLLTRWSYKERRDAQAPLTGIKAQESCVAVLNRLTEATNAQIVVSSTWRLGTELIDLREQLAGWGVKAPVIDKTPYLVGPDKRQKQRGEEIAVWLDKRGNGCTFVILDDDRDMAHLLPFLVRTNMEDGLTEECTDIAIWMLIKQGVKV